MLNNDIADFSNTFLHAAKGFCLPERKKYLLIGQTAEYFCIFVSLILTEQWKKRKKMAGRSYMGTLRTTFLIDENGIIERVIEKVNTKEHAAQILNGK